ncbi:MAG TPA: chromate transporter [Clostridia bacterium]|nr:chromate transporter [Clostridia bacterium]
MEMLKLIYAFVFTGLFAVGGGLATIPFLQDMGEKYGWFTTKELMDMVAISESTPGPIGINMATFVGIRVGGYPGGVLATLALVFPSIVVVLILIPVLDKYRTSALTQGIFYGLRPTSTALIAAALLGFLRMVVFLGEEIVLSGVNWLNILLFLGFFALIKTKKTHPVLVIAIGAALGMILDLA